MFIDNWGCFFLVHSQTTIDYATLGAASKLTAILATYPFQVIRSRLQVHEAFEVLFFSIIYHHLILLSF